MDLQIVPISRAPHFSLGYKTCDLYETEAVVVFHGIFGARINIKAIIEVKVFVLVK
jgi:hypothetical protein